MGWTRKAGVSAGGVGNFTSGPIDTSGANLIVVNVNSAIFGGTGVLSDSKSNTWTPLTSYADLAGGRTQLYFCYGPATDINHTFTLTGSIGSAITVLALSGASSSPPDNDAGHTTNGSASSVQPGSITPTEAGEIIITGLGTATGSWGTLSIDSGFTIDTSIDFFSGSNEGSAIAYFVQGAASPVNPTWSFSSAVGSAGASIASFKAAAATGGGRVIGSSTINAGNVIGSKTIQGIS